MLPQIIGTFEPGDEITLTVQRPSADGLLTEFTVTAPLGMYPIAATVVSDDLVIAGTLDIDEPRPNRNMAEAGIDFERNGRLYVFDRKNDLHQRNPSHF